MSAERVQPLRISKASPLKAHGNSPSPRPLVEIGPMERRRNSPSWNQATKKMIVSRDSSPFDSSGLNPQKTWHAKLSSSSPFNENGYDRPDSPSMMRHRASIENLKKVSRVKNSSMFAREHMGEYDPTSPVVVERPLAQGRPLSLQPQPATYQPTGLDKASDHANARGHRRGESQSQIPIMQPSAAKPEEQQRSTPSPTLRNQPSPTKSAFAAKSAINTFPRHFDLSSAHLSEDEDDNKVSPARPLRRQAKSVTFDAAPPQVNEYEMATPDPSSVADSREGSYDDYYDDDEEDGVYDMDRAMHGHEEDSFDASLEDTDKTPVVLPEDWRAMSPEVADTTLAANFEDPFHNDNAETPSKKWNSFTRAASHDSDGDSRPLPPVPMFGENHNRRNSGTILERVHNARSLPVPPAAASISKSDLLNMKKDGPVTIEDRLKLMGIRESQSPDAAEREKARLQRHGLGIHVYEDEPEKQKLPDFSFPRISRESILKKVRSEIFDHDAGDEQNMDSSPRQYDVQNLDPDVPIPSREVSSDMDEVPIKQESMDDLVDLYASAAMYANESADENDEADSSVVRLRSESKTGEEDSFYSTTGGAEVSDQSDTGTLRQEEDINTSTPRLDAAKDVEGGAALPEFSALIDDSEFPSSLHSYMSADEKDNSIQNDSFFNKTKNPLGLEVATNLKIDDSVEDVPATPESVIRQSFDLASPTVPDTIATVKAPGLALKTRPSAAPADVETMAATRRKVSGTMPPPVPEKSPKRLSLTQPLDISTDAAEKDSIDKAIAAHKKRRESFRIRLDIGGESVGEDLSLDMDKEFNRVIETSKKGYLMRQNTKVVVAKRNFSNERSSNESDRPASADNALARSNSNSRKPSHERAKSWTTEPWNGKVRRRSIRTTDKRLSTGPAPPLPGQESVTSAHLDTVPEDQYFQTGDPENGVERGRLFVKVVGVKDVDLPLPNHERTWFQLTLDNGLHCVTTSRLELGRSAPIGQEFELVVLNDLEFQLTLQALVEPPAKEATPQPTPQKAKSPIKKSSFSRFLSTPKKRREQDRLLQQQKEEEERSARDRKAQEAARRAAQPRSAWEMVHELVGDDGSFGRAYVNLKNHEDACFGRPITVDMPLFNEWAIEDPQFSNSIKSKRGNTVLRRPPYQIGNLTLQMLYVPRPKGLSDDDMPKSMNSCVREMAAAENSRNTEFEGFLSQQGGDCPYWRRRFFRLSGLNLIAFHETTRQPRTKISLARATKIIDDKTTLLKPDGGGRGGKARRRSAFADEDQAYMFVEEGFRMRFANGEAIDFYADSTAEKDEWMRALAGVIGKDAAGGAAGAVGWCDAVLRRERTLKERADALARPRPRSQGQGERPPASAAAQVTQSTPSSPVKGARFAPQQQAGGQQRVQPLGRLGEVGKRPPGRLSAKRHQIKSMIF